MEVGRQRRKGVNYILYGVIDVKLPTGGSWEAGWCLRPSLEPWTEQNMSASSFETVAKLFIPSFCLLTY